MRIASPLRAAVSPLKWAALLSLLLLQPSCRRGANEEERASPEAAGAREEIDLRESAPPIQAAFLTNAPCANVTFRRIGLGTGGALLCAAVDPSDSQTLYCGTDQDKVFRSRDGGRTWQVLGRVAAGNQELPGYGTSMCLAVDPMHPKIVWCGGALGLFRSEDGGDHWRNMTAQAMKADGAPIERYSTASVALDPGDPRIVYAVQGTKGGAGKERALFKSTDGGDTWNPLATDPSPGRRDYQWVVVDPTSEFRPGTGHLRVFRYGYDGAAVSSDGGATWSSFSAAALTNAVDSLVVIPRKEAPLLVVSVRSRGKPPGTVCVMKSEDLGETWRTTFSQKTSYGLQEPHPLGWSPARPETLYLGRYHSIDRSEDLGETWKTVTEARHATERFGTDPDGNLLWDYKTLATGNMGAMIYPIWKGTYQIAMSPSDPSVALVPSHDSLLLTTNGGRTWEDVGIAFGARIAAGEASPANFPHESTHLLRGRGLWAAATTCIAQDPFDPRTYAVGLMDQGLRISRDDGIWWEYASRGMDSYDGQRNTFALRYDPDVPGRLYVGTRLAKGTNATQRLGFYLSEDGGRTFRHLGPRMETARIPVARFKIDGIVLDPRSPTSARTLYLASRELGIFKSEDGGGNWRPLTFGTESALGCAKLLMHPADSRCLYAILAESGQILRTQDGGESWQPIGPELAGARAIDLAVSPARPDRLWIISAKTSHWASDSTIFLGDRRGEVWREIQAPFFAPHALGVNPQDPRVIYVSTVGQREDMDKICGLFRSEDGGRSWRILHPDLVPSRYAAFWMNPADPHRFFFTDFSAAFEVMDPLTGVPRAKTPAK